MSETTGKAPEAGADIEPCSIAVYSSQIGGSSRVLGTWALNELRFNRATSELMNVIEMAKMRLIATIIRC